ncbi:MAG: hypothetical protein NT069_29460 [Planctomycetota bacterium]|nr:hypothetical protein [Planctomycetota bacterium]
MTEQTAPGSFWAIVEVMGHSRHIGLVEEVTLAGASMLRVSTPALAADLQADEDRRRQDATPAAVVLLSPSALFRVTPRSEADCMVMLMHDRPWIFADRPPARISYKDDFDDGSKDDPIDW